MKTGIRYAILLALALLIAGCSKQEQTNNELVGQRSLDAWVDKYLKGITTHKLEQLPSGVYIEWLKEQDASAEKLHSGYWFKLNSRGTTLQGNVFMTRYEDEAEKLNTFNYATHYEPLFLNYSDDMPLMHGEKEALAEMRLGDSVRVYIPPHLGCKTMQLKLGKGFTGTTNPPASAPVIVDLVIKEIIFDEDEYEEKQVLARAAEWGLGRFDTVRTGLYLQKPSESGDIVVEKDATIYINYVCRFLDGFLCSTNVDSIIYNERKGRLQAEPIKYKPSDNTLPAAIEEVFMNKEIRHGSTFKLVTTSQWAYKALGQTTESAQKYDSDIQGFTPLEYEITVMRSDYKPKETEK